MIFNGDGEFCRDGSPIVIRKLLEFLQELRVKANAQRGVAVTI